MTILLMPATKTFIYTYVFNCHSKTLIGIPLRSLIKEQTKHGTIFIPIKHQENFKKNFSLKNYGYLKVVLLVKVNNSSNAFTFMH